ncbi:5'-nucleotidase C-terminal domain-containing protein [Vagococcus sp. DIV0080]|uniref:5'-nucleotidase C-terminal domain-containing protein n=1 Tax=Candidatus Vagococcus giribetii TaxID=2230876 RepID=A0ABS3HTD2_9ENTE|nr:5'-nucleotidase C-terminal domain-containing protein [Vagococcus sp. DIV0080]MBO0476091.1 5'-nucleotidase C-terminal domain-containing protein [Vagococcus sp. DIV0080]
MKKVNWFKKLNVAMLMFLTVGAISPSVSVLAETQQGATEVVATETSPETMGDTVSTSSEEVTKEVSKEEVVKEETQHSGLPETSDSVGESVSKEVEKKEPAKKEVESTTDKKVEKKNLTILGTSDVHGNVWDWSYEDGKEADLGFAKIGTIVKNERANNPNTLLVDAGDNLQGTLLTDDLYSSQPDLQGVTHPVIAAMNTIGYDAMALGNHEFNFGTDLIKKVEQDAQFPLLSANTYLKGTDTNFVKATETKMIDGVKVSVIGLTIPHVAQWDGDKVKGLDFKPLNEEARKQVDILKVTEKPDVIVAAIHAGLDNSDPGAAARNVITEVPEIDAFVLGHDHREFSEMIPDKDNTLKPVAAVKDTGSGVVKIDLELEKEVAEEATTKETTSDEATTTTEEPEKAADEKTSEWKVAKATPSTISAKGVVGDEAVKAATQEAHEKTKEYVNGVIGEATANFLPEERVPGIPEAQLQPTAMISLINNVQMKVAGADLGSAALFKADSKLNKGPIKYSDIFNIYKYPNTLVGTEMTGAQLKTYLENQGAYYQQYEDGDVTIGFNEKIRVYNYDMVSGVKYKIDISKPVGSRIKELTYQGKPVSDEQVFKIAMNNYRFEGMAKEGLVNPEPYYESDPATLRGEIVKYIQEKGTISPEEELESNFEVIGADLEHPAKDYIIEQVKKGTPGFEIVPSKDGRTPNVKKLNVYQLAEQGLIPDEYLEDKSSVKIMHTNDMHGRMAYQEDKYSPSIGLGRVKTFKDNQKPTVLVDAGDAMQGLPISNYSKGLDMVKAMNAVGYDAMTLGNHEFDFGLDQALMYQSKLTFPIVSANVYYKDGETRPFKPYTIVEKKVDGKKQKFALIGLTTPETSVKTHPNNVEKVMFKKPAPVAIETIKEIKANEGADYFVFMTHLGIDETTVEDETSKHLATELAKAYPKEKIFIADGHSHTALPEGIKTDNVLIGQTGNHLNNVGMMTADYSGEAPKLTAKLHPFSELKGLTPDPKVEEIVAKAQANFDAAMSETVLENNTITFNGERENARTRETNLGNVIGDALLAYGKTGFKEPTDFAIMNGGGMRQSIKPGKVTKGDIVGVMPFGNTVSQVKVTGNEIFAMFEHSLRSIHVLGEDGQPVLDDNGVPKLGANGGFLQVSDSIQVTYDSNLQGADTEKNIPGKRVTSIKIKDKSGNFVEVPRKDDVTYNMATNDFLAAGGDGYSMLVGKPVEEGPSMDEVFMTYLTGLSESQFASYEKELPYTRIISKLSTATEDEFSFTIMHTNDMHGRLQYEKDKSIGMAKLKTFKDEKKPTLMLDGGDSLQGLAISNFSEGMDMARAMSLLPYDAVAAGNHEFDFGYDQAMQFKNVLPMVAANVYKDGTHSFKPYDIIEKEGKKFAVIGLSTPETAFKTHPKNVEGVTFEEPIPVAKATINELQGQADAFIFVTHLGIDKTTPEEWRGDTLAKSLSEEFPTEKIIVIDGHSHSALREGQQFGNVLLAQTGNYLNNVGMIDVTYKGDTPTFNARLVPASEFAEVTENPDVKQIVDETAARFKEEMSQMVLEDNPVYLEGDGAYGRTRETNLGNLIADSLYDYGQTGFKDGQTDLAVINGGGIRVSINKGPVTKGDVLAVLPFGNTIAQIDVTGAQIKEMFEYSLRSEVQKDKDGQPIIDETTKMPVLGKNGGFLQVSDSVKVSFNPYEQGAGNKPEDQIKGNRVWKIEIRNRQTGQFELLQDDKVYKLATNDFLAAGGDGYTMLGGKREEGPSMDVIFTQFLQDINVKPTSRVMSLKAAKYNLNDYAEPFPYGRIVPSEKVDTTHQDILRETIAMVKGLNPDDYTVATWLEVEKALVEAETTLTKKDEALAEAANTKLLEAVNNLLPREVIEPNDNQLKLAEAILGYYFDEGFYTAHSWSKFEPALEKAADALLEEDEDVAAEALIELNKAAKETLISIESLMALVEEASRLKEADYTPESWKVFMKELRAAEELLDKAADVNQAISEETLEKAEDALEGAIKQLKLRKADPGKGKDDSGKGSQGGKKDSILPKTGEVSSNVAFIGVAFLSLSGAYIWLRRKDKDVA